MSKRANIAVMLTVEADGRSTVVSRFYKAKVVDDTSPEEITESIFDLFETELELGEGER